MRTRTEPTHKDAWAGALLFAVLFIGVFIAGEVGDRYPPLIFLRYVTCSIAVSLFVVGWMMRQREKDEVVMQVLLDDAEWRIRERQRDSS